MRLAVADITTDSALQPRVAMDGAAIDEFIDLLRADPSFDFPAVVVFYDGKKYWLADGFHRVGAYGVAHRKDVPVDLREGARRDALRYSLGANSQHGIRRTNGDKQRAVRAALDDEEWGKWSDSEIARLCAVDHKTVASLKASLGKFPSDNASPRTYTTKHGTTAKMNTSRIGKGKKPPPVAPPILNAGKYGQMTLLEAEEVLTQIIKLAPEEAIKFEIKLHRKASVARKAAEEAEAREAAKNARKGMVGVGVIRANEALNCLTRIPKNDALRERGFQIVTDWIKHNS